MIGLDVVDRLLGVPPEPLWRMAEQANRSRILVTWLSSAVARGLPVSERARAHLDRHGRRVAELHRLGAELAQRHGLAVIKGQRIAQYVPPPLIRQSGDVDLVAGDQESLWRCVLDLGERFGAVPQGVSVLDSPAGVHIGVAMKWPAEEPYLDKPMGADITTCAFSGDLKGVPVRVAPLAEDDLCGLFAVAEERFQRSYRIKDLLDLLVLAEVLEDRLGDRLSDVVCSHAQDLALAPELRQLIGKTNEWVPMSERWQEVLAALRPLARQERALRGPDRPGLYRLRFGHLLDTRPSANLAVEIIPREGGDVATTPVGTCLLVDRLVLREDVVAEAIDYARSLVGVSNTEGGQPCVT
jgi:hypothetical protein